MWHVTQNMWHITPDMWHVTCWRGWTFSQNFSSLTVSPECAYGFYELKEVLYYQIVTDLSRNTGNASKWIEIVVKGCRRAVNASNWIRMTEMSINGRKWIGNICKWIKLTSHGWARKFYIEYQCHVQSYAAAALAWERPGRISDFGIPFPNWRALLSRRQLGSTRLTVP